MRSTRGLVVIGIVVVLALFAPMATAGAATSPLQQRDTVTDVRPRKADIKAVRVDNGAVIHLTVRTVEGDDPATSPAWQRSGTRITWWIYFGSPAAGYDIGAGIVASPGRAPIVPVVDSDGRLLCTGSYSVVGDDGIRLSLRRSCITRTARPFRWKVRYEYVRPSGWVDIDRVPNAGVGEVVQPA